ncbi:MAG TPA: hypothetical protein DEF34_05565 [Desulfotomaculum sp.]|nr:MAG: hypothetical protein JL56_11000 [Desulfotomaculum sp. BICA1-6]HBX23084.1 hypothetical protein [Desulfotomaculum sp.]
MKQTRDLIGLPVFAVAEGDFVARVYAPVINPTEARIEYLLLEGDQWFLEKKCIAFSDVTAVGANALTTEKEANVKPVSQFGQTVKLLEKETKVLNAGVMTRDGRLLGTVSEFFFDESSGKITDCELLSQDSTEPAGIIPAAQIITIGQKYLVVAENTDLFLEKEPGTGQPKADSITLSPPVDTNHETAPASPVQTQDDAGSVGEKDPLELFSEKQRQYLIGKIVSKTIIDANGNIVVSEGTVITEDIIDRALRVDKYVDLTMFVE